VLRIALPVSLLLVCVLPAVLEATQDEPSPLLYVSADESSVENQIGAWLEQRGLKVEYVGEAEDRRLVLRFDGDKKPDFRVYMDTKVSATAKDSEEVLGRVILIKLWTDVEVPDEKRSEVLAAINRHANQIWAGCFYINDSDKELECQWPLNIPEGGQGIPATLVWDAIRKSMASWSVLYPEVMKAIYG